MKITQVRLGRISLAEPGCTEKPWMVTVAAAALKFSYSMPPTSPPSTV